MSKKIKIGWVGSGFVGQVAHLNSYVSLKDAEIVGLAELRPKLGQEICKKYSIKKYYKDASILLSISEVSFERLLPLERAFKEPFAFAL